MATKFVEIAVNVPQVSGVFHYHLPDELKDVIKPGQLVLVPFGRQTVQGVVMGSIEIPEVEVTKAVLDLVDPHAVLTSDQLEFARHLSEKTLSSLASCIDLMLPPGLGQHADVLYTPQISELSGNINDTERRFLNLLHKRGPLRGQQIERSLGRFNWRSAAQSLKKKRLIKTESVLLPPKVRPKSVRTAQLARPPEETNLAMNTLGKRTKRVHLNLAEKDITPILIQLGKENTKAFERRKYLVQYLIDNPQPILYSTLAKQTGCNSGDLDKLIRMGIVSIEEIPTPALLRRQVMLQYLINEPDPVDVSWLYAESGGNLNDLYVLVDKGLIVLGESEVWRNPVENLSYQITEPPPLTEDQQRVWQEIHASISVANPGKSTRPFLLHGVTGSGKTEIYLHAVKETLELGRQAIILVPEIALTPQTIRRFVGRFPGKVGLLHSSLSQGERYDTWRRARIGEISIIVGPRSALFTPFVNLGLIIVDESHDDSYYQSDPEPRYHARDAAIQYSKITGAVCIMGSATPDIVTYYRSKKGDGSNRKPYKYLNLPARILAHHKVITSQLEHYRSTSEPGGSVESKFHQFEGQADSADLPSVKIVDMRQELKSGNVSIFSQDLLASLTQVLEMKQQAILFLNRRGSATYVFCRDCGQSLMCPNCDIPLTYHSTENLLTCHRCNYHRKNPLNCPFCDSNRIRHYGTGTERVEQEVHDHFPDVRTLRWDYETTRKKGAHDLILSHFSSHRADILIGTQMLAKGLDLPLVTFVGAILADVGLNMPDYRSAERTFQILTQVAGRAGRSPLGGNVILQTFQPEHYVIHTASEHDYSGFFQQELSFRKKFMYPPFSNMIKMVYRDLYPEKAEMTAQKMGENIRHWIIQGEFRAMNMIGPVPCFFSRVGGYYRWQIILYGHNPAGILRGRHLGKWKVSVNPPNLL